MEALRKQNRAVRKKEDIRRKLCKPIKLTTPDVAPSSDEKQTTGFPWYLTGLKQNKFVQTLLFNAPQNVRVKWIVIALDC